MSTSMKSDRETDMTHIQFLIGLWQQEEQRLRSILENAQTAPSVRGEVSAKLGSVLDRIRTLADELDRLKETE